MCSLGFWLELNQPSPGLVSPRPGHAMHQTPASLPELWPTSRSGLGKFTVRRIQLEVRVLTCMPDREVSVAFKDTKQGLQTTPPHLHFSFIIPSSSTSLLSPCSPCLWLHGSQHCGLTCTFQPHQRIPEWTSLPAARRQTLVILTWGKTIPSLAVFGSSENFKLPRNPIW